MADRPNLRVLDLFSGIGGFSFGLERSGGFETVAFCEINPFARRVLAKHWPGVPRYDDVQHLSAARLAADGISVDVICGGFPCQDISYSGVGAGINGTRSGLWCEYARLIGELRPRYALVENVAALLNRGLGKVLGDLAALGYDAEWDCIQAADVGAPHLRDRIWIVAYPASAGGRPGLCETRPRRPPPGIAQPLAGDRCGALSNAHGAWEPQPRRLDGEIRRRLGNSGQADGGWWATEPAVGRVAHGVPARVDRVAALGNAVVPQIPEMIGHAILSAEGESTHAAA